MKQERKYKDFSTGAVWVPNARRYHVEIRFPDGTRRRRRFRREREAQRWWASEIAKIEAGTWNESAPKNVTLGKAFDEYREFSRVHHRSHRTYIETNLRYWESKIDRDTHLAKISTALIERAKIESASEVSQATVDKRLAVLKAFFNWSIRQGFFNSNPVKKVRFFHPNNEVVRYLALHEYQKLVEAAIEGPWYLRPMIELAANTGMRRGNLLSLRWDEIDLAARMIRKTKTKNGKPLNLPMNRRVVEVLNELSLKQKGDSPYVFPHREGKHAGECIREAKNSFSAALERAGIRNFRWHDLRHCFASWLVMGGANLVAVQKLLGHRSLRMTLRYAHLSPDYLQDEVKILDKSLPISCPSEATKPSQSGQKKINLGKGKSYPSISV